MDRRARERRNSLAEQAGIAAAAGAGPELRVPLTAARELVEIQHTIDNAPTSMRKRSRVVSNASSQAPPSNRSPVNGGDRARPQGQSPARRRGSIVDTMMGNEDLLFEVANPSGFGSIDLAPGMPLPTSTLPAKFHVHDTSPIFLAVRGDGPVTHEGGVWSRHLFPSMKPSSREEAM